MTEFNSGSMIILAYPEAFCTMTPSWYKPILSKLGVLINDKIRAGHSAILLVSKNSGKLYYTDFGRYITAAGMGRARNSHTDPEVKFDLLAKFDNCGKIINLEEILNYTALHPEKTHGSGTLYASVHNNININAALQISEDFINNGSIPYAPFSIGASNCSRYVGSVIRAGLKTSKERLEFRLRSIPVSSPLSNVFYGKSQKSYYKLNDNIVEEVEDISRKQTLKYFFNPPSIDFSNEINPPPPDHHFQWLSGLGSGSWFGLTSLGKNEQLYRIQRVNNDGKLSFDNIFKSEDRRFNIFEPYKFVYDCNALLCTVNQNGYRIRLNLLQ